MGQFKVNVFKVHAAGWFITYCSGAAFAFIIVNIFMPNVVKTDIDLKDESKENKHPEIPVKNIYNDALKNTAQEPGLNQAEIVHNELDPGIDEARQGD